MRPVVRVLSPEVAAARLEKVLAVLEQSRAGLGDDECWPWAGKRYPKGYGWAPRNVQAHRAVYEAKVGPVPDGLFVLHSCDNRPCVNYLNHLRPGTPLENMLDKKDRMRQTKGAEVNTVKLTEEQVYEIRSLYDAGLVKQPELAVRFGVYQTTISHIVRRTSWAWLPDRLTRSV